MKKKNDLNNNQNSVPKGKITGRKREKEILHELMRSKKSEFIAIYGRRRVGKTYLIKNYMDEIPCVFFHVTGLQKGTIEQQLEEFAIQIGKTFYNNAPVTIRKRWRDAFEDLTNAIETVSKEKRVVLFFDELPWMATPRSNLLYALELYWNRYWVFDDRLKLIVCGSATSWIIENIINNKGGLHNRVTRSIDLKPFSLYETESYLKENKINLNQKQILDLYTILGGVPLYWSFVKKGRSAHQIINELCFQNDGPLTKEFERLFGSLFKDPKPYIDLIRIISKHHYGIGQTKLIEESKLPDGGGAIRRLTQLEEVGFITSLIPYSHKDKGVYYLIDDEYSLFYLRWIEPNLKAINKKAFNRKFWLSQSKRPAWKSWAGLAFESICYKHIDQIRDALDLDPGSIAGTWRSSKNIDTDNEGAQIDLLFDRPDGAITLCEIKSSEAPFVIDKTYYQNIVKKIEIFRKQTRTKKQLFFSMITTSGLKTTIYSEEIVASLVTLEDLFHRN